MSFICWIGVLINTKTLEVQADYTRYRGEDIAATINFSHVKVLLYINDENDTVLSIHQCPHMDANYLYGFSLFPSCSNGRHQD